MRPTNCLAWAAVHLAEKVYPGLPCMDRMQKNLNTILETRDLHIGDVCCYFDLTPAFRYGDILDKNGKLVRVQIETLDYIADLAENADGLLIGEGHAAALIKGVWYDVNGQHGTLDEWEHRYKVVSIWLLMS